LDERGGLVRGVGFVVRASFVFLDGKTIADESEKRRLKYVVRKWVENGYHGSDIVRVTSTRERYHQG